MATPLPVINKISRTDYKKTVMAKTLSAQFGDGYSQEAPDGINNIVRSYEITWAALTPSEKTSVEGFLESVGGWGRISWTPPYEETSRLFIVKDAEWELTVLNNSTFSISCELKQVYL